MSEILFHGNKISTEGVRLDNAKIKAIIEMPEPTNVSGVKTFCGIVQYMAKFMPDLASLQEPIRALTRKDVKWHWSNECQAAFENIKTKLTEAPVLAYFDPSKQVVIQVDSSKDGMGAVLFQD